MKKGLFNIATAVVMLACLAFAGGQAWADEFSENNLVFLCFGQSNMEGNARPESVDYQNISPRFKKMYAANSDGSKLGTWATAAPPLVRSNTGLTPVDYFGRYLIDNLDSRYDIRVIVVAVAGCSLKLFDKDAYSDYLKSDAAADWLRNIAKDYGSNPYGRLIELAKEAQKTGVIRGILMHQGETDGYNDEWVERADKIYKDILADLGLNKADVKFLVGEVVNADQNGACAGANDWIAKLAKKGGNYYYLISSAGCPAGNDRLHFTAEGYRMLGERYGQKMFTLLKRKGYVVNGVEPIESDSTDPSDADAYNLSGQHYYDAFPGIKIINGKKYLIR